MNDLSHGDPPKEIEIAPEMIEAGCEALWDSDYGNDRTTRSSDVVVSILFKALKAAGFSPRTLLDPPKVHETTA
jgi:hypothetical protein